MVVIVKTKIRKRRLFFWDKLLDMGLSDYSIIAFDYTIKVDKYELFEGLRRYTIGNLYMLCMEVYIYTL
jgi:hypothetical protein